jgi:hypothetical protein
VRASSVALSVTDVFLRAGAMETSTLSLLWPGWREMRQAQVQLLLLLLLLLGNIHLAQIGSQHPAPRKN